MFNFFKTMESVAQSDEKEFSGIAELTKEIALSAGYHRDYKQLKNGKIVERTFYDKKFDDVLVAKWYVYFKRNFISVLLKHKELEEFQTFILQRTFSILFNSFNMEKLSGNAGVVALFNMSLANRIGEALGMLGSEKRLEEYRNIVKDRQEGKEVTTKKRLRLSSAINHMAASLEDLHETNGLQVQDDFNIEQNLIVFELNNKLKDNPYGTKLLNALLYSGKKVNLSRINEYLDVNTSDADSLNNIKDAFNIIKNTLKDYVGESSDYDFNKKFRVNYDICK